MPLITFEGADGAGKSTQVRELSRRLDERGISALTLREPGGTGLGERVRSLLKDPDVDVSPMSELLLFSAARAELVRERVAPALATGRVVILDRFTDSTLAYQGVGRGLGADVVQRVNAIATGGLVPDLTIHLELPDRVRTGRIGAGGRDRIEQAGAAFYAAVTEAYRDIALHEPERMVSLDADRPADVIAEEVHGLVIARVIDPVEF